MTSSLSSVTANASYPGLGFHPSQEDLVKYYLLKKILGEEKEDWPIDEINLSEFDPVDLPYYCKSKSDRTWFFFHRREYMDGGKKGYKRKAKNGHWKMTGKSLKIMGICQRRIFVFQYNGKNGRKAEGDKWIMHEYEMIPKPNLPNAGNFVAIRVEKKKCKKTKKNGSKHQKNSTYEVENNNQNKITTNSACYDSEERISDVENENEEVTALPTHEICELSCEMASSSTVNHSPTTEVGEDEWSLSMAAFFSIYENKSTYGEDMLMSPVNSVFEHWSPPITVPSDVYENQTSIENANANNSMDCRFENLSPNYETNAQTHDEDDWQSYINFDIEFIEAAANF